MLPLFRTPFGGLWIDRRDAHDVLSQKNVDSALGASLKQFIEQGYVVFENAVPRELCDEYESFVEETWRKPPAPVYAHWQRQVAPLSMSFYDDVAKVSDLHYHFRRAEELIYPKPVLEFLRVIYEREPVVFQTMTMRKGSEEELHNDTGPLTLTEPYALVASWLALEDVDPLAGALMYVPGSHHEAVLVNGVSMGHNGDYVAYGRALAEQRRKSDARGLETKKFLAKKGDIFIWAADLLHGGAPIEDRSRTRKSIVSHFAPYGAFPTFYDYSSVSCVQYPSGGYRLDRVTPYWEAAPAPPSPVAAPQPAPQPAPQKLAERVQRALGAAWEELRK